MMTSKPKGAPATATPASFETFSQAGTELFRLTDTACALLVTAKDSLGGVGSKSPVVYVKLAESGTAVTTGGAPLTIIVTLKVAVLGVAVDAMLTFVV